MCWACSMFGHPVKTKSQGNSRKLMVEQCFASSTVSRTYNSSATLLPRYLPECIKGLDSLCIWYNSTPLLTLLGPSVQYVFCLHWWSHQSLELCPPQSLQSTWMSPTVIPLLCSTSCSADMLTHHFRTLSNGLNIRPLPSATIYSFLIISLDHNSMEGTKTKWWRAMWLNSTGQNNELHPHVCVLVSCNDLDSDEVHGDVV